MLGLDGGADGVNSDYMARRGEGTGATIMGRNMFGPVRGEWPTPLWNGWWGDEPPFDHDVFVLTNHARPSVVTANNTRFHFVTEGPESALDQAREAAGDLDVLIAGGVQTIRQYVARNEVDELNLVIVPTYLGEGESLYDGLTGQLAAYDEVTITQGEGVSHVRLSR